jgi:hypothetical protein
MRKKSTRVHVPRLKRDSTVHCYSPSCTSYPLQNVRVPGSFEIGDRCNKFSTNRLICLRSFLLILVNISTLMSETSPTIPDIVWQSLDYVGNVPDNSRHCRECTRRFPSLPTMSGMYPTMSGMYDKCRKCPTSRKESPDNVGSIPDTPDNVGKLPTIPNVPGRLPTFSDTLEYPR